MVTIYKIERADIKGTGKFLVEFRGLEGDDKPTSIGGATIENGSSYLEMDTGKVYYYDLENTTWVTTPDPEPVTPDVPEEQTEE